MILWGEDDNVEDPSKTMVNIDNNGDDPASAATNIAAMTTEVDALAVTNRAVPWGYLRHCVGGGIRSTEDATTIMMSSDTVFSLNSCGDGGWEEVGAWGQGLQMTIQ